MKPALTPEQWATFPDWPTAERPADDAALPIYFPSKHGIAAANLYGQPFGFTQEDVKLLREDAEMYAGGDNPTDDAFAAQYRSLADRIAALLP